MLFDAAPVHFHLAEVLIDLELYQYNGMTQKHEGDDLCLRPVSSELGNARPLSGPRQRMSV